MTQHSQWGAHWKSRPSDEATDQGFKPCPDGHSDETFEDHGWECCRRCGREIKAAKAKSPESTCDTPNE